MSFWAWFAIGIAVICALVGLASLGWSVARDRGYDRGYDAGKADGAREALALASIRVRGGVSYTRYHVKVSDFDDGAWHWSVADADRMLDPRAEYELLGGGWAHSRIEAESYGLAFVATLGSGDVVVDAT